MIRTRDKRLLRTFLAYLLSTLVLFSFMAPFTRSYVHAASPSSSHINDWADLFTQAEEEVLLKKMAKLEDKYKIDIVILTVDDRANMPAEEYAALYADQQIDAGLLSKNCVVSIRDIEDRWIDILTYGTAKTYVTDLRAEKLIDAMSPDLRKDDHYQAYSIFLTDLGTYLGKHPNPLTWTWVQLLIALAIGGGITAVMVSNSQGKVTTTNRTYLDEANSGLVAKRDMFINTSIKRIHQPKPPSSSGGGGGGRGTRGRTPGGRSYGGAGRRV